jgi:predicted permease
MHMEQSKQQQPASFPTPPCCCIQGVLDARGRNSLSRVNFYVFIPSLTFSKLAASVDLTNIGRWWFLPVNIFIR